METQTLRPQIYEVPHKAIRNALSQLTLMSGNTDYNDNKELEKLQNSFKEIFEMLDVHAAHENNVTLKHLESKIGGSSNHDMEDHEKIEARMRTLEKFFNEITQKKDDRTAAGIEFYEKLSEFHANYLLHMLEEEQVTQPLVWKNFNDEEIMQQEIEIRSAIPPGEMLIWCKYLMPAIGDELRIHMLSGIKANAPSEFYDAILKVTESVISKDSYDNLINKLN
ncbi:MAG: hemerythrin domain-containing protein [Ignavibacteria bacterium]|jgi:iron-sulfur cluster repair protein YtfE (RIC family)|nr:hemerythrin domain-containing protein [Ignavibacteria bacterium]